MGHIGGYKIILRNISILALIQKFILQFIIQLFDGLSSASVLCKYTCLEACCGTTEDCQKIEYRKSGNQNSCIIHVFNDHDLDCRIFKLIEYNRIHKSGKITAVGIQRRRIILYYLIHDRFIHRKPYIKLMLSGSQIPAGFIFKSK